MKIEFARIFVKVEEEGFAYWPYIIAFQKVPIEFGHESKGDGYVKVVPKTWKKKLIINLWLVVLRFDWQSNL